MGIFDKKKTKKKKDSKPKAVKCEGYKVPEGIKLTKGMKFTLKRLRKDGIALIGESVQTTELVRIEPTLRAYPVSGIPGIHCVVTTEKYVKKAQEKFPNDGLLKSSSGKTIGQSVSFPPAS